MIKSKEINKEDLDLFLVTKTTTFIVKLKAINSEEAVRYAEKHLYEMNIKDKTTWSAKLIKDGK